MAKVFDVANFFIDITNRTDEDQITNLKLNKLLYFAQGCFLSRTGKPLFEEEIEAWALGPVVPSVYHKYKVCGKTPITTVDDDYSETVFSPSEISALVDVMRDYGRFTASALVNITHRKGTPWQKANDAGDAVISKSDIKHYFTENPVGRAVDAFSSVPIVDALPKEWYDKTEDDEWEAYV